MKKNLLLQLFLFAILLSTTYLNAQKHKCSTMDLLNERIARNPSVQKNIIDTEIKTQNWISTQPQLNAKRSSQSITIPVVVHVLYNTPLENISDDQIKSQIDVLNADFELLNTDSLPQNHPFWTYTASAGIEFCLAKRDPQGNKTTGITRTFTNTQAFAGEGDEKFTAKGGVDNWDPTKYLNLWVCNLDASDGTLGYATFPSDLGDFPKEDGVVIRYQAFGVQGTTEAPNDLGRTATHEVGHWLNLRHIWGDDFCGDDLVSDTAPAYDSNYGCPNFPYNPNSSCGTDDNGEMYMNYMDYVDDNCMHMFSYGQTLRMNAALSEERAGIKNSLGCVNSTSTNEAFAFSQIELFPNPSDGNIIVNAPNLNSHEVSLTICNMLGKTIQNFDNIINFPYSMNLQGYVNGVYFMKITANNSSVTEKFIINK